MEERISIRMTERDLYDFLLFHTYSRFSGFLTNVLGAAVIFMGLILFFMGKAPLIRMGFFVLAGAVFIAHTPFQLRRRAKRLLRESRLYQNSYECIFGDAGISVVSDAQREDYEWERIEKVVAAPRTIGFYYDRDRAIIIPKGDFADRFVSVLKIVLAHIPRERVKIY